MMFNNIYATTTVALGLLCGVVNARILNGIQFGLITVAPNTPVDMHGLSIGDDNRLLFATHNHDPFIGVFAPDGRITVPNHNAFLAVGGINSTSLEVHNDPQTKDVFDVNSEGRLMYNGSTRFVAVKETSGAARGNIYRFYVYDAGVDYSNGIQSFIVEIRLLYNQGSLSSQANSLSAFSVDMLNNTLAGSNSTNNSSMNGLDSAAGLNSTANNSTVVIGRNISTNGTVYPESINSGSKAIGSFCSGLALSAGFIAACSLVI